MATSNKILLHPIIDGVENKSVNLYPKTSTEQVEGISNYALQSALTSEVTRATTRENAIANIAAGKTKAYTVSLSGTGNSVFNSTSAYVDVGETATFTTLEEETIEFSDLRLGDIVYIVETTVPDRWFEGDLTVSSGFRLYALDGDTPQLTNYYTKTQTDSLLSEKQANLTPGTNISIDATTMTISATDVVTTDTSQSISGVKTFGSGKLKATNIVNSSNNTLALPSSAGTIALTSDIPSVPTVNNSTITITQGGTTKGSFTLNQSNSAQIDLDSGGSGGVTSIGGATGAITLGNGLNISGNQLIADLSYSDIYSISGTLSNLTMSGSSEIEQGGSASVTLVASSGYALPSTLTSVTGATYSYNSSTGVVSLSSATGDVVITASGVQQLTAPTISLSGDTLTIGDVTNAESYDLYVDGEYNSNIPIASGYSVTITANSDTPVTFYDGTSTSGTLLGTISTYGSSETYSVTSGNIYFVLGGSGYLYNRGTFTGGVSKGSGNNLTVTSNGTAIINIVYGG